MASIYEYKLGNWRAVVRRRGYKTRSQIFPNKKLAEIWARDLESKMDQARYIDPERWGNETVAELFTRFRDDVSPTRKGVRWERTRLTMLLRDAQFTKRKLNEFKSEDLRAWRDGRLASVSPASVGREMNLISAVFTHARKEWGYDIFATNPMRGVSRPKGASGRYRERRWEDHEIQAMVKAAGIDLSVPPKGGEQCAVFALLLALETAMRLGELVRIVVQDINFKDCYLTLWDTKNGDKREVPLSDKALALLEVLVMGKKEKERLFPYQSESLGVLFREVRKKAGLAKADLTFHDSRHEAATRLAEKLTNVLELSAVTGHKTLQNLKRYYNPRAKDLAKKLN